MTQRPRKGNARNTRNSQNTPPLQPAASPLSFLTELLDLEQLIPPSRKQWLPLISEGLSFFLQHLPPAKQVAILAQLQMQAFTNPSPAGSLLALLMQCPTLHKLGQVIARHPELDPDLRCQLQQLESLPPSVDPERLHQIILNELILHHGPAAVQALQIEDSPLAEGSVAVIVPFSYLQSGKAHEGVFKLLKPDILDQINTELALLAKLAPRLEASSKELQLPTVDFSDLFQTVQRLMHSELQIEQEQKHLQLAARFFKDLPDIQIPSLLPWCTPNMTAMQRIHGQKITAAKLPLHSRKQLAHTLVSSLLGLPFLSLEDPALIHGDLHAGNLFLTHDGQIAVLDWGLTTTLTHAQRQALVQILLGALLLDAPRIQSALNALCSLPAEGSAATLIDQALDRIALHGQLPALNWLLDLFDELLKAGASFPEELVLIRKTWQSLWGVLNDLTEGQHAPDRPLIQLLIQHFLAELPARPLSPTDSRDFSTKLSNLDLLTLATSSAIVSLRFWNRWARLGIQ